MAYYRPTFISQFGWGDRFDSENCNATCAAILLDRQTHGRKTTTPLHIRSLIDSPNKSGGLSMTDDAIALKRGFDEDIVNPLAYEAWDVFLSRFREGRGAIVAGDCSYKRGTQNCPGPSGELPPNHAIYLQEDDPIRERVLTYDPSDHSADAGIQWLSYKTLQGYTELWTKIPGTVNAAYSKVTAADGGGDGSPPAPGDMLGCLGGLFDALNRPTKGT